MKTLTRVAAAIMIALAVACSPQADPSGSAQKSTATESLVVFAAASLSKILPEVAPGETYSFDGSSALVDQLAGGARADVFASADKRNMDRAVSEGLIEGDPVMFATNHLVLITPKGNPASVTGLDGSLANAKLVICSPEVPCGAATARLAKDAGVTLKPVSEESKVTDVLGKVASGEADAGFVYATDAAGSGKVDTIEVPGAKDDPNTYWVGVVKNAANPEGAKKFVSNLAGPWQEKLQAAGFGPPR